MAINSLSASSYGLAGLVSGINTEEMVTKLLSGTQAKIDKATQKKATLQNKQTMYREVISKLKTLQNSYLSFTSGTNLLSNSFYNNMQATLKTASGVNAAFSVTASSNAKVGTVNMDYIQQLATAQTKKTNVDATGKVDGIMSQDIAERIVFGEYGGSDSNMVIMVGNRGVTIENAPETFGGKTQSEIAQIINDKFAELNMSDVAEAKFVNNKLQIVASNEEDYIKISGYASATDKTLSMRMFGAGITTLEGKGTLSASINSDAYQPSFEVNLDGRQQTIYLDLAKLKHYARTGELTTGADGTADSSLLQDLQDKLLNAFGAGVGVQMNDTGDGLEFFSGKDSQKVTLTGDLQVMGMLGIKSGMSNKLNTNMAIKDLNFNAELQGNHHTFKINGVEFSYDSSATLSTIMNDINTSKAGVKVSYIESEDRFVIQSAETGEGTRDITIEQSEGNLMSALFGVKGGSTATGYGVNMDMWGTTVQDSEIANGGVFTFNVNGTDYKFTVSRGKNQSLYTTETLAAKLNAAFADTFGVQADGTQNVVIQANSGQFVIRADNPDYVVKAVKEHKDTNTHLLGFTPGQATVANRGDIKLGDAGITFGSGSLTLDLGSTWNAAYNGGSPLTIAGSEFEGKTMFEMADIINGKIETAMGITDPDNDTTPRPKVAFDPRTASFKFTAHNDEEMKVTVNEGANSARLDRLFGQKELTMNAEVTLPGGVTEFLTTTDAGKNAIFSIDGSVMERASNTFTIDGLTYTLHGTTHKDQKNPVDGEYEPATQVAVTRDTEKIVEGIDEFLKLYNETMDYLNDLLKADATYKDYAPLTEEQKKNMSDREIELWEEKSKEGLLRNDQNIERIMQAMRKAMYTKPEGSSIALYDLGITTSFYSNDGNLNPKSLDDLRSKIENDPEALANLFAGEGGIMELLNTAITDATKSSYAGSGYLTSVAGSNALDTQSTISRQIAEIDSQMVSLESRYWKEYDRYWKQFNQMEQIIQNMNTQSSWLSQMSG